MFFDEFQRQKDKVQRPDKQKSLKLNSFRKTEFWIRGSDGAFHSYSVFISSLSQQGLQRVTTEVR